MSPLSRFFSCLAAASALVMALPAHAGVSVQGNRVIYPAGADEISVRLSNDGPEPVLLQSWVSAYGSRTAPDESREPFVVLPPLTRVEAGARQVLRLRRVGGDMPEDRESVFTLTIAEIPARSASNSALSVLVRNRLKLFYRPQTISKFEASSSINALRWSLAKSGSGWALQASNESPLHVSVTKASLRAGGREFEAKDVTMVAPFSFQQYPLQGNTFPAQGEVRFKYISEHGAVIERTAPLGQG